MAEMYVMEPHIPEQIRITKDVFGTMVDITVEQFDSAWPPNEELVTSAVYFTDPWKGALLIECTLPFAYEFTKRLIDIELPTSVNEDVCDAMGELANMVAGNLKSLMPAGVGLSMPSIVRGVDYILKLQGGEPLSRIVFASEYGNICITLVCADRANPRHPNH